MMKEFIRIKPFDAKGKELHYGEVLDDNGHKIYSPLPTAYTYSQIASIKE